MKQETISSILPVLIVVIPFIFAVAIALVGEKQPALRNGLVLLCSIITFGIVTQMFTPVIANNTLLEFKSGLILGLQLKSFLRLIKLLSIYPLPYLTNLKKILILI